MDLPDEELFQRIQARDANAFDAIYARYAGGLRRHLIRMLRDEATAEDVLQETLLRLWTHADRWDGRGTPRAWLYRIATNQALNSIRATRRRRQDPLTIPGDPGDLRDLDADLPAWMADSTTLGPEQAIEHAERTRELRRLVDQLPAEKRLVIRMVHELEMEIAEVARTLGIPTGTVKSRLHYATRRLARHWREADGE